MLTAEDCDDSAANSTVVSDDADCDGVPTGADCDDSNASSTVVATDADCDGTVTAADCDDLDASSTVRAEDADCDGVLTAEDCDDSAASSTVVSEDTDCDGTLTAADCDDSDGSSTVVAIDADCDDTVTAADCDDLDASSTVRAEDADCDGVLTLDDCDDSDATSTTLAYDPDCDGVADCGAVTSVQGADYVMVCPGTFDMGCTAVQQADGNCYSDESPVHTVTLSRGFWISATELTQGQWQSLMGNNPSHFSSCGADCPVEYVDWWDSLTYANALSTAEGLPECYVLSGCGSNGSCSGVSLNSSDGTPYGCAGYRLPTEAEWEYAARAGTDLLYSGSDTVDDVAWRHSNSGYHTNEVATKQPNAWGLYDMSGNVWEWNWDWYDDDYYSSSPAIDPTGAGNGASSRVIVGGSWDWTARLARVACRSSITPGFASSDQGFRLLRTIR